METTYKYFEKKFRGQDSKEVYLQACKWLATNVISKPELEESLYRIKKKPDKNNTVIFKVELFCYLDDVEAMDRFCRVCQESHKAFYINEDYNCSRCNVVTFRKRLDETLVIKKGWRRQLMGWQNGKDME